MIELDQAVTAFYGHLSAGRYSECYRLLDPKITARVEGPDRQTYTRNLAAFARTLARPLTVDKIDIKLFPAPSVLYGTRDFAMGVATVLDAAGRRHVMQERWVLDGDLWYTRCVGYAVDPDEVVSCPG